MFLANSVYRGGGGGALFGGPSGSYCMSCMNLFYTVGTTTLGEPPHTAILSQLGYIKDIFYFIVAGRYGAFDWLRWPALYLISTPRSSNRVAAGLGVVESLIVFRASLSQSRGHQ